jgi:O-antigen biosynthesis protein WbqP
MLQEMVESSVQAAENARVQSEENSKRARGSSYAKRAFDLTCSIVLLPLVGIVMAAIAVAVKLTSKGPALYWSGRVGRNNRIFRMPKFRTMNTGTPEVATHLLRDPQVHLTQIGPFLRRTSLDELPQIYCILKGDLSFVGPRPALHNQVDLVRLRTEKGVHDLVPGLTGWAQINGRDDLPIPLKVEFDCQYLRERTFLFDLEIICRTLIKVFTGDGIAH